MIVPHSLAARNKLEIFPPDKDEPSYAGVMGMKLSVVGQCPKTMKTTKIVRAIVVADEGEEVLIDMETLIQWGIIPVYFHLTMNMNDRVGGGPERQSGVLRRLSTFLKNLSILRKELEVGELILNSIK